MSDGASPSPCLTLNAISPAGVRLVFSADEAGAAPATSASVDKTVIERRKPLGTSIAPTTHEVLALSNWRSQAAVDRAHARWRTPEIRRRTKDSHPTRVTARTAG